VANNKKQVRAINDKARRLCWLQFELDLQFLLKLKLQSVGLNEWDSAPLGFRVARIAGKWRAAAIVHLELIEWTAIYWAGLFEGLYGRGKSFTCN